MHVNIQPVLPQQLEHWLRLRQAVYPGVSEKFHRAEMQIFLADGTKQCFLAIGNDDEPCGMAEVTLRNIVDGCLSSPVGYIEGLYVDPAYRGKGISRLLLESAEHWCRDQGCIEIGTDAELENVEAQRFHERMGFKETYRIVEYRKDL